MGRSISKGPYIAYHLLNKLEKLNSKGSKEIIKKHGHDHQPFYQL